MANPELFRQISGRTIWGMLGMRRRTSLPAVGASLLALAALGIGPVAMVASAAPSALAAAGAPLVGTFRITPGACRSGASGSYFRMILPTGNASGPYIDNADSTCAGDHTYTLFTPGTDGGLITGVDQPAPSPGFDAKGNSLAGRVIRPVAFFGVQFAVSTNPKDLQTGATTKVPTLQQEGGKLTGDLSAFAATWNKQAFNQGAPKPDGTSPGNTAPVAGTFDPATGHYSLTWASQIVGGPFDKFTGQWHLEGTFVAAGAAAPTAAGAPAPSSAGAAPVAVARASAAGAADTTVTAGAAAPSAAPNGLAAPASATATATGADRSADKAALAAAVHDDGFQAPVWLVIALALAGIGGVIALLVIGPRHAVAR